MVTVIINDCRDPNAMSRQMARVASLLGGQVVPMGVQDDLEAAGCLVDALDALGGKPETLILANVASRNGYGKKWANGSPFGYFYYQHTLVMASIDGLTLSLIKKLGCLSDINVLDIPKVTRVMASRGVISKESVERIDNSQFRSFDFLPYAAEQLLRGASLPSVTFPINAMAIPETPKAVWYIDCFGNAKTTLLPEDIDFSPNTVVDTRVGPLSCFKRLVDVPDRGFGLVIGSSGIEDKRFLEIVSQGGNAAEKLGLKVGQVIL